MGPVFFFFDKNIFILLFWEKQIFVNGFRFVIQIVVDTIITFLLWEKSNILKICLNLFDREKIDKIIKYMINKRV